MYCLVYRRCTEIAVGKLAQYLPNFVPRDATRDCAAFAMLPVLMLPVIVYNLISNFLQMQRKLDGTNSKRSHLHRWIKSVKILSDALTEDLKAATRKNEIGETGDSCNTGWL